MSKFIRNIPTIFFMVLMSLTHFSRAGGDYNWPKYEKVDIPDSLKNVAAFFISNVTTIDFYNEKGTSFVVFQRIFINSEEGAKKYANRDLFVDNGVKDTKFFARTLKADGRSIELNASQITETYSTGKNKYGDRTTRKIELNYPDVEEGDIVDLSYEINLEDYALSRLMFLESFIPSLYSRITIRNMSIFDITAYPVNNMIPMVSKQIDGVQTVYWEENGVGVLKTDYFNAIPPTAPFFVYNLWHRGESIKYETIYHGDVMEYPVRFGRRDIVKSFFEKNEIINKNDDSFINLIKIIKSLEHDFTWNKNESTTSIPRTSAFLAKKQVDEVLFFRYIMEYLNETGIKYDRCFTKSLLDGRFEHGFVSFEQLSKRFLIIYDQLGQVHYLFPPTGENRFYYLDEIPFYIEGNQSIALYGKGDFLDENYPLEIPSSEASQNTHFANILIDINRENSNESVVKRRDTFKGQYSYLTRNAKSKGWLKELNVKLDEFAIMVPKAKGNFYPYEIEFNQESKAKRYFSDLNDSLTSFDVSRFLPKGVFLEDENEGVYDTYLVLPFLKQNEISIFLKSEQAISMEGETNALEFSNEVGSIKFQVVQMSENVLKLKLNVEIKERFIDGNEKVEQFKELIQTYSEIKKKKWVVKIT